MKKSTKKTINYLRQYIGHEIIRTRPAHGDWSRTDVPVLLLGFTPNGCIVARVFGNKEHILPIYFTDRNWITYKKAQRAANNPLNKWKGKKIERIRPTSPFGDRSFMNDPAPTLISASKHHMVIMHNNYGINGKTSVLNSAFVNPDDWVLAE